MAKDDLDKALTKKDETVPSGTGRACVITMWTFVILGYLIAFVIEQYYGYQMYYGMIVFLVPAVAITLLYVVSKTIAWLWKRH